MFVCHGNICRSPMAEFIFKDMVETAGMADLFEIASSATSTEEIWNGVGNPVYPPAKQELDKHGISCRGKRAVQLKKEDYLHYDFLIGMEAVNIKNMLRILGGDPSKKVHTLLEFAGKDRGIADPWYTGNFEKTYDDIVEGCKGFMDWLKNNHKLH